MYLFSPALTRVATKAAARIRERVKFLLFSQLLRKLKVFFKKICVYLIVFVVRFSKAGCSSHDHSMLLYTLRGKKEK